MEAKKNPAADLARKSSYFFSIGLVIALSLVIAAFEWESHPRLSIPGDPGTLLDPTINIPITDVAKPQVPRVAVNPKLVEVDKDTPIDSGIVIPDIIEFIPGEDMQPAPPPKEDTDIPVDFVEFPATPVDGFHGFYRRMSEEIKYPMQAKRAGIEGRVFVQFVVNRDGSLSDAIVLKGIGGGCDEEALRVIHLSPAWKPAQQGGRMVRQRFTLPIIFSLEH